MVIAITLLAILFLVGFINTLFYIPPNKFLAHLQSFLPYKPSSIMTNNKSSISTVKEEGKKKNNTKSVHEVMELEKVFSTFDKNGDGFITRQELGDTLRNIGLFSSDKEVASMIEKLDINGDGLIDLEEFCEMYESIGRSSTQHGLGEDVKEDDEEVELRDAFDVFDGDKDGVITVEELVSVLSSLGLKKGIQFEDCKEMIKKVDMDGDGMVNFDEFKHMMKTGGKLISVS
ncbi:hypothetical protein AQUCO_02000064v1 [Aquilegia coerulea]|uniref:EF-hand domain-containing protein n=1 Tax=Aquilegia coerulea TaxID=218851 RepID=A0A2G5DFQ2_AQUCA|nr:hypothetical protein AQUCO_02000064v1 [Aquilegia coerulea]